MHARVTPARHLFQCRCVSPLRVAPERAIGLPLRLIVGYRFADAASERAVVETLAKNRFWRGENVRVRLDGTSVHVESAVSVLKDDQGDALSVVIADDNRDSADSLRMLLELEGHSVQTAHDGAEAFDLVERVRPRVVLLDIGMPKLSGHEVAAKIRAQPWGSRLTLIAFTGWGQLQDRQRALDAGFDHHMTKPVDPVAVISLLRRAQLQR